MGGRLQRRVSPLDLLAVDIDMGRVAIRDVPPTAVVGASPLLFVTHEPEDAFIRMLSSFATGSRDDKRCLDARGVIREARVGQDVCVCLVETHRIVGTPDMWTKVRFHHSHRFYLRSANNVEAKRAGTSAAMAGPEINEVTHLHEPILLRRIPISSADSCERYVRITAWAFTGPPPLGASGATPC